MTDFSSQNDSDFYRRLLDFADEANDASVWSADELADIWRAQLDAKLPKCIEELSLVHALHCQTLCEQATPPIVSVRDLFARPRLELLRMFAKWNERELGDPAELVPRDIAVALFNITIVLARLRCNSKLIGGTDTELARRANWVAHRAWIDAGTAKQMGMARDELGGVDSLEDGQ